MRGYLRIVLATAFVVSALAVLSIAADDPFVGTWKLNVAKSTSPNPDRALRSRTTTIEATETGYKEVTDSIDTNGNAAHWENVSTEDGKDHESKGNPRIDTQSITKVDKYTRILVQKKSGQKVGGTRTEVSKDGKTMTRTSDSGDQINPDPILLTP